MNKRGWIKIIEAFFAALMIIVVAIIIVSNNNTPQSSSNSVQIYNAEIYTLRVIELNNTLRSEILNLDNSSFPLYWDNVSFPNEVKQAINFRTASYLSCEAQICNPTDQCDYAGQAQDEIYVQSILITATNSTYSPRKLKLFCWIK
jgi:hypothetical protein